MTWSGARTTLLALIGGAILLGLAVKLGTPPALDAAGKPQPSASASSEAEEKGPSQLHGRIVGENGDAVTGAHVRVLSESRVIAETTTRAGEFSFSKIGTRRVRLEAEHDPEGAVRSAELALVEETPTELTLVLAPAGVNGVVVDGEDGHTIANATLSIEGATWPVANVTSDDAGAFRFPVVPFEAKAVLAVANGYRSARVAFGPREDLPEVTARLELRRGEPADGDVIDPDGKPVHAQVIACEGASNEARIESGDDGTFRLPASSDGCDAIALHEGMTPSDATRVVSGRHMTLQLRVGGAIAGVVVDERGSTVDAFSIGVEAATGGHKQTIERAPSEFKNGTFRIERLVPGTYVLTAFDGTKPPVRSDPIDVRAGATTDGARIVLGPGGVLVGRVLDEHNTPIADVDLKFDLVSSITESHARAKTDASGAFRLEGAPAGPFTVRLQKEGFRSRLVSGLWIASGHTLTKDITLTTMADGGAGMELGGIGAGINGNAGAGIFFQNVFPNDPASRAGLQPGDQIVRIDGEDAANMSVAMAIQKLRGEEGTSVGISVLRNGATVDLVFARGSILR